MCIYDKSKINYYYYYYYYSDTVQIDIKNILILRNGDERSSDAIQTAFLMHKLIQDRPQVRSHLTWFLVTFCRHVWIVTLVTMQPISYNIKILSDNMKNLCRCLCEWSLKVGALTYHFVQLILKTVWKRQEIRQVGATSGWRPSTLGNPGSATDFYCLSKFINLIKKKIYDHDIFYINEGGI